MGVVITVMNMKGGVGKTTVAAHLAGIIARYQLGRPKGRNVLLIDYDPQFNLSQSYLPPKIYFGLEEKKKTTLSILIDDETELDPYSIQISGNHNPPTVESLTHKIYPHLDIIPSTLDLMYVALGISAQKSEPIEERFKKFIAVCEKKYDIIVIDCHPAGSIFTKTSLRNSDQVIIPVAPQRYAVRGVGLMMNFIKAAGIQQPIPHILFNAVPRVGVTESEKQIRANANFSNLCMQNTLKKYSVFSEPEGGIGFVWVSKKPYSTEAFRNLLEVAKEVLGRTGA